MAKEKQLETRLKRFLESKGIYPLGIEKHKIGANMIGYYNKRWGGGQFAKAGLPDVQVVIGTECYELELKAGEGKPTLLQMRVLDQINRSGGFAAIITDTAKSRDSIIKCVDGYHIKVMTLADFKLCYLK